MFRTQRTRGRRVAAGTVALATTILIAVGVTGATADSPTTSVAITPLTPVKTVTTGVAVAAGKTYAFVASGGSTTVPTNAFVVQLGITVKGAAGGTLSFAPLGDPGGASPTKVTWPAGGTGAGTVKVNIGVSNKVVVSNASTGSATVGIKITGYSTQTTAAGINGSGGTSGQVLTNNGDGTVAWKTPAAPPAQPVLIKAHIGAFGTVKFGNVTATRTSIGVYQVSFGRNLAGCALSGSVGVYGGGQYYPNAVVSFITFVNDSVSTVKVTRGDTLQQVDSDFYVTAIC
ncbi:MAG TPA: hypothetical protein VNS46_19825 [Nocardioides sp.]|nr:hypothetical protein [Nocardioides sp.]